MKNILLLICFISLHIAMAQKPNVEKGHITLYENFQSKYVKSRTVAVWTPESYNYKKKFSVLYMHDGQMLFDANTTWNGQEWGVDETLSSLIEANSVRPTIVVGVWNTDGTRHCEYFPQKPFETLDSDFQKLLYDAGREIPGSNTQIALFPEKVQSDNYLRFLVTELKPFIDRTYKTKKGRRNTYISGSSMGGLISIYALCEYPKVFGGAACLSTHWPGIFQSENNPVPDAFMAYLKESLPKSKAHKLYFDYGSETLDALYKPHQIKVDKILEGKGYNRRNWISREFFGEDHSENAWRKRLHVPIKFLLKR